MKHRFAIVALSAAALASTAATPAVPVVDAKPQPRRCGTIGGFYGPVDVTVRMGSLSCRTARKTIRKAANWDRVGGRWNCDPASSDRITCGRWVAGEHQVVRGTSRR